jgi:hypothetical protein
MAKSSIQILVVLVLGSAFFPPFLKMRASAHGFYSSKHSIKNLILFFYHPKVSSILEFQFAFQVTPNEDAQI